MYSWDLLIGDAPQTLDARHLRQALGSYPTGVCLVTTVSDSGKREGMTINSFASVSLAPPLILWSVRDAARSADIFIAAPSFIVSVLSAGQHELATHFAKPSADKFASFADHFDDGISGCPRLRQSVATYECTTYSRHSEGDHTILIGRVEKFSRAAVAPLFFHAGRMGSAAEMTEGQSV